MSFFSTDLTKGKLILLYFLNETGFALSEEQLFRIVNKQGWLDYFSFQQAMSQMRDAAFIAFEEGRQGDLISITELGKETIQAFAVRLPASLRAEIDDYVLQNVKMLREEAQFSASFERIAEEEYRVRLQIFEQDLMIYESTMLVYAQEAAQTLCERWAQKGGEVYAKTLEILTQ